MFNKIKDLARIFFLKDRVDVVIIAPGEDFTVVEIVATGERHMVSNRDLRHVRP